MSLKHCFILSLLLCQIGFTSKCQVKKLPSKEESIQYIKDKIENYGVAYVKTAKERTTIHHKADDIVSYFGEEIYTGKNCRFYENSSGGLWLKQNFHYSKKDELNNINETKTWITSAPFNRLKEINIIHSDFYRAKGYPVSLSDGGNADKWISHEADYLELVFDSKCVYNSGENEDNYTNYFVIAFREGESNLLEKMRRAFLNLKRFYPTPAGDPFEN